MRRLTLAFVLLPLLATLATANCGQPVETCDTACTLDLGAASTDNLVQTSSGDVAVNAACLSACNADQTKAIASGDGADFQWLLTCIGNAQSFSPLCLPLACGLTDAFGIPTGCGGASSSSDAGGAHDAISGSRGVPDAVAEATMIVPTTDAAVDVGTSVDAAPDVESDAPEGACSTPVVDIGLCGIPMCCRFSVTWSCGSQAFSVGGGCDSSGDTPQDQQGYNGTCDVNGEESSMFEAASTPCACDDPAELGAYVTALCDVSPPP